MTVEVIIPVYRPGKELAKLLNRINQQTLKAGRVLLMHTEDGMDLSWVQDICGETPVKEILVEPEAFDHGGTRHLAMEESQADIVICMTQDAVPMNRELFAELVAALVQEETVAVAYARQIAGKDGDILEAYARKFNYPSESKVKSADDLKTMGIKTYFCSNVCAAYKRRIYEEIGGFEKHIIFNEDMVYAAKAVKSGYKIAYQADAVVEHTHTYTAIEQLRRNFDLGVSQANYPEIFQEISSEKEGIRLVIRTAGYLLKKKKPLDIPRFGVNSVCKYMGYRLGRVYRKLPEKWVRKLTMNRRYWERKEQNG